MGGIKLLPLNRGWGYSTRKIREAENIEKITQIGEKTLCECVLSSFFQVHIGNNL